MDLWEAVVGGFADILRFFHDGVEPLVGPNAWGWSIILLTLAVRVALLPLTVKGTTAMRRMQTLQPEMTRIREKYKVDRSLMRSDPERYRAQQTKQQEELSTFMREHNVNPVGGCLPLLAQVPVGIALFQVLQDQRYIPELLDAPFYFITRLGETATGGGIGAYLLLGLQGVTTLLSARQTARMSQNPQMQQQQQLLQYMMPVVVVVFGVSLPVGVLLYWVTTNVWTIGQQYVLFRGVAAPQTGGGTAAAPAAAPRGGPAGDGNGQAERGRGLLSGLFRPAGEAGTTPPPAPDAAAPPKKGATASKGTPTPKRSDARNQHKGASRDTSGGRRGNGRANGKGRPGTPAKPKR